MIFKGCKDKLLTELLESVLFYFLKMEILVRSFLPCSISQAFDLVPTISPGPINVAIMNMDDVPKKTI